jgi:uncharacterized protein with GYD domain
MPTFCHHVRYTTDGWNRSRDNATDRFAAVRAPIEKLGGSLRATYFTNGSFDVLAISEFPEHITSSDISVAFADGGAIATIESVPLLTDSEAVRTWAKFSSSAPRKSPTELLALAAASTDN